MRASKLYLFRPDNLGQIVSLNVYSKVMQDDKSIGVRLSTLLFPWLQPVWPDLAINWTLGNF